MREGSHIYTDNKRIDIPAAPARHLHDPTGCGDAFRAGLLYGLMNNLDWETTGRIAALMGAIKIEHHGTQNHSFTPEEFAQRYLESFGSEIRVRSCGALQALSLHLYARLSRPPARCFSLLPPNCRSALQARFD